MKIKTSICSLLALCGCLYFTSCSDELESGAPQNLSIASFYPTIVMEGTEVEVNGTAMNRVTEVVFPGGITSTDITVVDERILTVIAPAGVSETEAPLIVRAEGEEAQSRQTIREAHPTFSQYNYTDNEGAVTGTEMTIEGSDLLLVDALTLSKDDESLTIPALEMSRKTTDAIRIEIPEDAPIGEGVGVTLTFKNGTTMELPEIEIIEGTGGGSWVQTEITLYEGEPVVLGAWSNSLQIEASKLADLKEGDIIRVYFTDVEDFAQGSLKESGSWQPIGDGLEYFDLTADEIAAGYYMRTFTADMIAALGSNNLVVGGQNHTVTKVSLFTSVWVEGGEEDLRDPITDETIVLIDYEDTGSHNSSWDGSWTAGVVLEFPTEANGNIYCRLAETPGGDIWLTNCNHIDHGTVQNIENYAIKFDLLIEEGVTGASAATMQIVLADNWLWVGEGLFPETTNGQWITVSRNIADIKNDLTGELSIGTLTNGLYGGNIPAGICIDNLRLDPIE